MEADARVAGSFRHLSASSIRGALAPISGPIGNPKHNGLSRELCGWPGSHFPALDGLLQFRHALAEGRCAGRFATFAATIERCDSSRWRQPGFQPTPIGLLLFNGVTWFTWAARGVSYQCQTGPILGVRFGDRK
jgi:hypothetical protein